MRFTKLLVMMAVTVSMGLASTAPATASTVGEVRSGVERADSDSSTTLMHGVKSLEQLADYCEPGLFCGYGYDPNEGRSYQQNFKGCGRFGIPWYGSGWWINNLSGATNDRVAMYDFYGDKIYTTPHSPYQDTTADWTDVWTIKTCVA